MAATPNLEKELLTYAGLQEVKQIFNIVEEDLKEIQKKLDLITSIMVNCNYYQSEDRMELEEAGVLLKLARDAIVNVDNSCMRRRSESGQGVMRALKQKQTELFR